VTTQRENPVTSSEDFLGVPDTPTHPLLAGHRRPVGRRGARHQLRPYLVRAWVSDVLAVAVAIGMGVLADRTVLDARGFGGPAGIRPPAALAVIWLCSLLVLSAYDARVAGTGPEEYKRVTGAALLALGVLGTASYLTDIDSARRFLLAALPIGLVLMLGARFLLRGWLGRSRAVGRFQSRTIVVGQGRHAAELADRLRRDAYTGYAVVATVAPPAPDGSVEDWLDDTEFLLSDLEIDAVAVAEMSGIDSDLVRRLSWRLEGPHIDLMVAPGLSDLAGPRLSIRPASGLPLLHLDEPQLNGPRAVLKRAVDLVGSVASLIVISPLLLLVTLAIAISSRGPVFYTQRRVGQLGQPFSFVKFRTMVVGAHEMRDDIIGVPDEDITTRYRYDPRITRVGRVLRRWSIDELPQLIHVVTGQMSLVGPRPLLVDELPLLVDSDHRRHMIKPGLTGLWQVSGRKDVEWDERMRLDLWYVENWSPALDLVIILRTFRAIVSGHGAY